MSPADFDSLVEEALKSIPARFRRRLRNLAIIVEPEPPRPGLLGLYEGTPATLRSAGDPYRFPDRIVIFQGPHERLARNPAHLRELVRETVWHEVGHYFGLTERQIRQALLRRQSRSRSTRQP